ncbi:MAG: GspE/PulE family protein [Patescibacteria group bacterium]|nr:GspE/PulE family protein [Patescibacteria group bacterium]
MSEFDSISSLLKEDKDDSSPQAKFLSKQQEIKNKEIERQTQAQAQALGLSYIDLFGFPISPEAISLIPEESAIKNKVVCFFYDGENIRIATSNPKNPEVEKITQTINKQYFTKSNLYLISDNSLKHALSLYKTLPKIKKNIKGIEITEENLKNFENIITDYKSLNTKINEVNISDVVTLILATALKSNASDVHIEAESEGIVVRLRIDGVLQEAATINKGKWKKIISRMKMLAGVKINIEDKPQDGRYSIFLENDHIDVRSSFLPTAFGESVVMRLLRSSSSGLSFDDLGIRPQALEILKKEISRPNGLVLTTGPTGSGKTTTLYAILNKLNQPNTKIITLEDPIEYQLEGISQSQIDPKKDYTFASGLRSILRQDPNIVMVGEIRDIETAEISVQASLTGHLVLSTLHTNDASGVIPRMIDIGIKPYFLVPSINAVIGQRLIRKLCPNCKKIHELTEEEELLVKKILSVISPKAEIDIPTILPAIYKAGDGCENCAGIGYKGRTGIYEIFTMDDKLKQLTIDSAPSFKILQQAIENGMVTMLQDGILKAMDGETSLEEVYRVVGNFDYVNELYDIAISQTIGRGIKIKIEDLNRAQEMIKNPELLTNTIKKISTKDIITILLALSVEASAGDLHIEPTENDVKVRFRIDGILHDMFELPKDIFLPLLGEVKILAGFKTNVKKATMDGRFTIFLPDHKLDCRISIISGGFGETIVIRLLTGGGEALELEKLGLSSYDLPNIKKSIKKTKGIILTTGPTGSGKTTTLYSILKTLNTPDVKIITVEDPIEYQMEGIIQTQIDNESNYTFAAAMRSLLRQNPNIMMIGEIRDSETAKIAIEAAMTGHLVLSTVHTNSAAGAVSRFMGLGVERSMLANSLECSIGQRLVRKICPYCEKEEVILEPDKLEEVKRILSEIKTKNFHMPDEIKFYRGKGCDKCKNIGYKGRLGLYEILNITPEIQKMIIDKNVSDYEIEKIAIENGMTTVLQDGILKALVGLTTIDEVFRSAK